MKTETTKYVYVVTDEFKRDVERAIFQSSHDAEVTNFPINALSGMVEIEGVYNEPQRIDDRAMYNMSVMEAGQTMEFYFVDVVLNPANVGPSDVIEIFNEIFDEFSAISGRVSCLSIAFDWGEIEFFIRESIRITDIDEPRTADKIIDAGEKFVDDHYHSGIYLTACVIVQLHGGNIFDWEYVGSAASVIWRNNVTKEIVSISRTRALQIITEEE